MLPLAPEVVMPFAWPIPSVPPVLSVKPPPLTTNAPQFKVAPLATANVPLETTFPVNWYDPEEIVMLGMIRPFAPPSSFAEPVKVCVGERAVNVPLFTKLPPKPNDSLTVSIHRPPALIVTSPVNDLVPLESLWVKVPLTVVVPLTVILNPATVSDAPVPTTTLPPMVMSAAVVAIAVPLRFRLPLIIPTLFRVLVPLPDKARWL